MAKINWKKKVLNARAHLKKAPGAYRLGNWGREMKEILSTPEKEEKQ